MRADQIERIRALSERLADRFIADADPDNWSASDKMPVDMTQQERGDAYWCKKNAMATGGVLRYALDLLDREGEPDNRQDGQKEADIDRAINDAERRAAAALSRVMGKAKGEFDKRVTPKASTGSATG